MKRKIQSKYTEDPKMKLITLRKTFHPQGITFTLTQKFEVDKNYGFLSLVVQDDRGNIVDLYQRGCPEPGPIDLKTFYTIVERTEIPGFRLLPSQRQIEVH